MHQCAALQTKRDKVINCKLLLSGSLELMANLNTLLKNNFLLLFPLTGLNMKDAQVVALSTGTKCINGEYISNQGLALNDCHAEIIVRRSLVRFLYSQLDLHLR